MSLKHILLGMLRHPSSGYDLKKKFNTSLRHFWRAELSQIYPQLQKLEQRGFLTSATDVPDKGPPRKIYHRTAEGREELISWLAEGPIVGEEKISYLAQVNFLGELPCTEQALEYMQQLRDYMSDWLIQLEEIEREWAANDGRYPDALPDAEFYSQLTLALGRAKVKANIDWCEQCMQRIRARQRPS